MAARDWTDYRTPGGGTRAFCRGCGSALWFRAADGAEVASAAFSPFDVMGLAAATGAPEPSASRSAAMARLNCVVA